MKLLQKNINPYLQAIILTVLVVVIVLTGANVYRYCMSVQTPAAHENYAYNSVCSSHKIIGQESPQTAFIETAPPDYSVQKATYRASVSLNDGLLTVYGNNGDELMQSALTDAYVDVCGSSLLRDSQPQLNVVDENSIEVAYHYHDGSSLRLKMQFYDTFFTYVPEISVVNGHKLAGQSFFKPHFKGNTVGILNPDAAAEAEQGIFQQHQVPSTADRHLTTSVLWQRQYGDEYIFSPTTDAWYVLSEKNTVLHGLAEINRASGIDIIVPKNSTDITYHYANISGEQTQLSPATAFSGMQSIVVVTESSSAVDAFQSYYDALSRLGLTAAHAYNTAQWWNGGVYCNWFEHHAIEKTTEEEIESALTSLEQKGIIIKTVVIDEGWAAINGDWTENRERFPGGLRQYIDSLHDRGYKVMLHFIPFSVQYTDIRESDSPLLPAVQTLTRTLIDYSDPLVRGYIRDAIKRMLSDASKSYNADGLKLDFVFDLPPSHSSVRYKDATWGRGEDYVHNSLTWIYETAKEIKPDALIVGEGVNPFFQDAYDANRTNDITAVTTLEGALMREKIQQILMPELMSFNDLYSERSWNFTEAAYQYAYAIPHIVFKVGDLDDQDIEEAVCLSRAYDRVKNDLVKKQVANPFSRADGINAQGDVIWDISDDGKTVHITADDEVIICRQS
ncbi:MAG: TIM-barrel domain-containing protein [Patescibacteria group bacterium]